MSIDIPDELLAKMWDEMNWTAAEDKLASLQERLTIAVYRKNDKEILQHIQKALGIVQTKPHQITILLIGSGECGQFFHQGLPQGGVFQLIGAVSYTHLTLPTMAVV